MGDFVALSLRRNRGWPWPEDSWGLTPMFGEDGWCRSCGVPRHAQSGDLVLRRKGLTSITGAWTPHWQFDVICLERELSEQVAGSFRVELRDVDWHGSPPGEAMQIVVPTVGEAWFDPRQLRDRLVAVHGTAGARCGDCGVGDGLKAFRQLLVRRALAQMLVAASPRDVRVVEVL